MRTIKLYGELRKRFGKIHKYKVKNTAEALRALCANYPEFEKELATSHERNIGYRVFTGKHELESEKEVNDPSSGDIKIIPMIMGANATTRILVGAVLIVAGAVITAASAGAGSPLGTFLITSGASLVLGGVIELLSPVPKIKEPAESPENKPSYLFNGPVNTTAQGHPVPVGYGRLIVGGGVVSAGINVDQIMAGFRRVQVERKSQGMCVSSLEEAIEESCFLIGSSSVPSNFFRRELISYEKLPPDHPDYWLWKHVWKYWYYYYETIVEAVPV